MKNPQGAGNVDGDGDERNATPCSSSSSPTSGKSRFRLFGSKGSVHQHMGGGKAADVLLWKQQRISFGVTVVATVAWLLFERSGLPFLTVFSNVLLILVVLLLIHANYAALRNQQLKELPELVLSEEMVSNAAASFRLKVNNMLLIAHDITIGKDFGLFFKVVAYLWILSVIGSYISFFTIAYIGSIALITLPALYNKYEDRVDKYCGMIHHQFSKHYKIVDENVFNKLPQHLPKDKDL